jgi:hypothetical protein
MWSLLSFAAGFALGLNHFRMYRRMLEAMTQKPADAPFARLAVVSGLFRHIFTLAAGILLIQVAKLDPFHLCGGLFAATVAYRAYLFRRRDQNEETEAR